VTAASDTWDRLADLVGAPDFIRPWLDRFYDPEDATLILAVGDGPRTQSDLAVAMGTTVDDLQPALRRAHRRYVFDAADDTVAAASFADRSALWAQLEGWKDVPAEVRARLADWWVTDYAESIRDTLTKLQEGHPDPGRDADYAYLLLTEAEELVRSHERVYLWPCDCRTLKGACDHSIYNCIRFVNDRDIGWEISQERAIEIIREADRAGLTHTDYVGLGGESDPHAICNCCTCCCQPHLATERLGMSDVWPRRRHVARLLPEACTLCGTCTERCPFGALSIEENRGGSADAVLALTASACRGCGLCATGCPEGAIAMDPRPASG
jgi:ferredoxin